MKPLERVVVLDLTRLLSRPYCTLLLAGLGAQVIRVEPPPGARNAAIYGRLLGLGAPDLEALRAEGVI